MTSLCLAVLGVGPWPPCCTGRCAAGPTGWSRCAPARSPGCGPIPAAAPDLAELSILRI
ncbi:hypothetical protein O1L55_01750 [Streptomyces albulus]|nr:hypothetical protein [Streptomyces noursei]